MKNSLNNSDLENKRFSDYKKNINLRKKTRSITGQKTKEIQQHNKTLINQSKFSNNNGDIEEEKKEKRSILIRRSDE